MLKILRIILAVIVIVIAVFSIIIQNFVAMPFLMLLLSVFMLVSGLIEYQKDKKGFWLYIIVSIFIFLVAILGYFLN